MVAMMHRSICFPPSRNDRKLTGVPARAVEMSREFVVLACKLGQQLLDRLLHLGEFLNECLAISSRFELASPSFARP
jgi:hypothetical protein